MPLKPTYYVCKKPCRVPHAQYPGLCSSCGESNLHKRGARAT